MRMRPRSVVNGTTMPGFGAPGGRTHGTKIRNSPGCLPEEELSYELALWASGAQFPIFACKTKALGQQHCC